MSYKSRSVYGGRNDDSSYSPDKKDIGLARSLGHQSPNATHGQILSIQGRQYKAYNKDPENDKVQFERYFSKEHEQNQKQQNQIGAMQKQIDTLKKQGKATPSKPKAEKKEEPVENPLAEMRESYDPYEYGEMLRSRHEDARGDSAYNPEAGVNNENGAGDFMNDYKINIQESMADAGVETRGPDSLQAPNTTDDDDKDDEVSYNV